jgi:hypothetical protein
MNEKPPIFHIAGDLLGFAILETYNTASAAINRLQELAAAANDIAEGDPRTRCRKTTRYVLTDATMPDLMDVFTGDTLVGVLEQFPPR